VFETPGIYTVKLTASHAESADEIVKENFLMVLSANAADANFSASQASTYAGGAIRFEDLSTGEVVSRKWTFEGGVPLTSEEQHPTVTYHTPGRYAVTLEVFDVVTSSTKAIEGYVLVVPSEALV